MKQFSLFLCAFMMFIGVLAAQRPEGQKNTGRPVQAETPAPIQLDKNRPKGSAKITGMVQDAALSTPIEYATVTLLDAANNKPLDGALADEKGSFSLKNLAEGSYKVQVSFLGYKNNISGDIALAKNQTLNLGVVLLEPDAKTLNEVTVTGQKALIEEKVDRLVYNAENDLTSRGGSASDLLRKVPLLEVDLDGNLSLRGSQNISVLINGKPSAIMAGNVADALKQIPSDLIKSVEVITSPSAKYDAEGSAGIVNIILKKNNLQGYRLGVDMGVGTRSSNLGLNGSLKKGKLGMSIGGHGRMPYNRATNTFEQEIVRDGVRYRTNQVTEAKDRPLFGHYNLGMDYDISQKQSLSAGLRFGTRNFKSNETMSILQYQNDVLYASSERDIRRRDLSPSIDVNLDYLYIIKPQHEWSISTQYSRRLLTNNFFTDFLDTTDIVSNRIKNINGNTNNEFTVQTDYQTPITKSQNLEFGAKGIFRTVNSDFEYLLAEGSSTNYRTDPTRPSGLLDYKQNVGATYLSHTLMMPKDFTLKTGVRYEYTTISAASASGTFEVPDYGLLVPSINVSKKLSPTSTLKLGYNRRIQRPGLQQLNPNVNTVNPQSISYGNALLEPELTDNLELGISKNIGKAFLNMSFFGRQTNNAISDIRFADDTLPNVLITTFDNIGQQKTLGTNLNGNIYLTDKWTLNGGIDVAFVYLKGFSSLGGGVSKEVSNTGFNLGCRLTSQYRLKKGWSAEAFGMLRGTRVQLQGFSGGWANYKLGVKKDFANKKGSLGLGAENFLTNGFNIQRTELTADNFTQSSRRLVYNRGITLTFSYNLGKMTDTPRKKTRSINNDDLKGGDDGGQQQQGGNQQPTQGGKKGGKN